MLGPSCEERLHCRRSVRDHDQTKYCFLWSTASPSEEVCQLRPVFVDTSRELSEFFYKSFLYEMLDHESVGFLV